MSIMLPVPSSLALSVVVILSVSASTKMVMNRPFAGISTSWHCLRSVNSVSELHREETDRHAKSLLTYVFGPSDLCCSGYGIIEHGSTQESLMPEMLLLRGRFLVQHVRHIS